MSIRTKRLTTRLPCQLTFLLALLVGLPVLFGTGASAAEEADQQVLVISSYNLTSPGIAMATQSLRAAFRNSSVGRAQFYHESIDTNRITEPNYADDLIRFLKWKYKTEKIDLVVIFGGPAMQIVATHRADFLPDTPVLYYYFDEGDDIAPRLGPLATGVYSKVGYGRTLETALSLQPKTEKAFIISGSSALDKHLLAEAETQLHRYEDRVEITYLADLTIEEAQQKLSSLPPRSVVIFVSLAKDRAGKSFNAPEAVSLLAASSNAPMYGVVRTHLGYGIVGGSLIDFEGVGTRLGELGLRIIGGERPQAIAPQAVPNVTTFDWRELQRWGLGSKELPAGSLVQFQQPSFWQHYKWIIIAGILVTILQTVLIGTLLVNRARRQRAEADRERLAHLAANQRRRLGDVIANVPGIVWEARFEPDGVTIKPKFVSHYIERLLGYSVDEWMSTPGFLRSIIHEEDQEEYQRQREALLTGKTDSTFQFRWRAKDGRLLWAEARTTPILDEAGSVVGMRGVALDITSRKQAEADLVYQSTILASVHDAIVATNPQFKVTAWNHAAEVLYGWRADEALGRQANKLIGTNLSQAERAEMLHRIIEDGWVQTEMVHHHRDGTSLYVQAYTIALRDAAGHITGYVSAHRDVTERRRAEEALRESNQKLQLLNEEKQTTNEELLLLQEQLTDRKNELERVNLALQDKVKELGETYADLRNFIESANIAYIFLDRQLRIKRYTPQAGRLFNIIPDDINRPLAHLTHSFERTDFLKPARQVLEGSPAVEHEVQSQDGHWYIARLLPYRTEGGQLDGVILKIIDISERRQAEERLRRYFDLPLIGMAVTSTDRRFVEVNQKLCDMLGYPMDELKGKSWIDVTHPDDVAENVRLLEQTLRGETEGYTMDKRFIHRDGHIVYACISARCVRRADHSVDHLVLVIQDITKRKQAEERLRGYFDLPLIGMTMSLPDRRFIEVNQKFCDMLGYSMSEMKQKSWIDVTHPDDVAENVRLIEQTLRGEIDGYTMDKRFIHQDGHIVYACISARCVRRTDGSVDHLVLVIQDISERKQAEERLRGYFDLPLIGMAVTSPDSGYLEVNQKFCDMLGYPMSEMKQKNWIDVTHPDDVAENVRLLEQTLRGETEGYTMDKRFIHRDGHIVYACISASCVRRADGSVDYLVAVVQDITERKQAEAALHQSEQRTLDIVRAMPDLMFLMAPDGTYLDFYANDMNHLLVPPDQFIGKTMWEVMPADLAKAFAECFERAKATGEPQIHEYTLPTQGELHWYEARIVYTDSEQILSIVRDITARKRAAEALRDSEERLRLAQRAARIGTWEWNIATGESTWSEGMYNLLGLEQGNGNVHLEDFIAFIHPEDRTRALAKAEAAANDDDVYVDEFRIIRRDGAVLWLMAKGYVERDAAGNAEWMIGVNIDITERKQMEVQLAESEARFRSMADTAPVMIWVAGPDSLCTYVNQRWLDFTGRTIEQDIGNGWAQNIHPDDYENCIAIYSAAFDRREPFQMEYRLRRADGEYRWVFDTGVPRFSASEKFLGYIGSCIDVTDSKKAEAALHEAFMQVNDLKSQLEAENIFLKEEIRLEYNHDEILGNSEPIRNVLYKIEQVAPADTTVLITGETGTGKELVASAIHRMSLRKDKPLVKVNCAALPATLIESELFGHERGAFTSASTRRLGRFELANGGTIFLDEIGDLPPELQVKLLRVLQDGEFERLGSGKTIKVDVRIITATNRNLPAEIEKGQFREDLWYRLNVFPIHLPPLRDRRDDIPLLVEAFVQQYAKKHGKTISSISPGTMRTLMEYSWPGNVRELINVIERAMVNSEGPTLRLADQLIKPGAVGSASDRQTLEDMERQYIVRVLKQTNWRIEGPKGAARILGLNPSTLRTRMHKLNIHKSDNGSH